MNQKQRIAFAEADLTVKRIGQILDKHPNYLSNVLSGRYPSPQIRKDISRVLGKSEGDLWPEDSNDES